MIKVTKDNFRRYLNEQSNESGFQENDNLLHLRNISYGDYLYRRQRDLFNKLYDDWKHEVWSGDN
jgi:hypothetical protein